MLKEKTNLIFGTPRRCSWKGGELVTDNDLAVGYHENYLLEKKSGGNRFLFKKGIVLNISFFSPSVAICADKTVTSGTTETAERYFS